jgi:hypothetical protein
MKKRLFELAQRAKKCHSPYTDDFLEKFAELIINDCDKIMQRDMKSNMKDANESFKKSGWNDKATHDSYKECRRASTSAIKWCRIQISEHFEM